MTSPLTKSNTVRIRASCESCERCPAAHRSVFKSARSRPGASEAVEALRVSLTFARGEQIPLRRASADGFLCLQGGYVKLSYVYAARSRPVRICGPGDLVGYGYWHCDYRLVPEALDTVAACFFERERFLALQDEVPEVSHEITKLLCRIALQKAQRISLLQSRSVGSRVAGLLTSLERKFGERTERGSRIPVPLDRKTLASLSGTVVETVARTLSDFEKKGWIARDGRRILLQDKDALNALAYEVGRGQ